MTGGDERPGEATSESGAESSGDAKADSAGSRFDKFFDHFDDPDHAGTDTEALGSLSDSSAPSSPDDATSDPDGWVWGAREASADTPALPSEQDISDSRPAADDADDRLWNDAVDGERLPDGVERDTADTQENAAPDPAHDAPTSPASSAAADASESPSEDEPSDASEKSPDPAGGTRAEPDSTVSSDDHAPSTQATSDRWAALGSNLTDATDMADSRSSDPEAPDGATGPPQPTDTDDERPANGDDTAWSEFESGASTTGESSQRRSHQPSPISDDGVSGALDRVVSSPSVLVLGPTDHSLSDAICSRFLTGENRDRDVLFVTFEESPNDRIEICHRADGWAGGKVGIIEVGRGSRNSPAVSEVTSGGDGGSITVRHVSKPGDLSKLGIVITKLLSEFDETPRKTVLCFHTLTALHTQVGTKTLFRFLNTLQGRLNTADAVGHYHMDPDLHDEIVIETLRPIFDSVVRFSADGELKVE